MGVLLFLWVFYDYKTFSRGVVVEYEEVVLEQGVRFHTVIPAQAGIYSLYGIVYKWIPAYAGMTRLTKYFPNHKPVLSIQRLFYKINKDQA
jgi:hypothetical protein